MGKDEKPLLTERANTAGEIIFTGLPLGDSRITVTSPGFKNLPVIVTVSNADELKVNAKLEVGSVVMGIFLEPAHKKRKRWWIF